MIKIGSTTVYSLREIAEIFETSEKSIRSYVKRGKLNSQKIGGKTLVTECNLMSFLNNELPQSFKCHN
jgi:hypothetical protein